MAGEELGGGAAAPVATQETAVSKPDAPQVNHMPDHAPPAASQKEPAAQEKSVSISEPADAHLQQKPRELQTSNGETSKLANAAPAAAPSGKKSDTGHHQTDGKPKAEQNADQPPPLPDRGPEMKPVPRGAEVKRSKDTGSNSNQSKRASTSLTPEQIDTIRRQSLQFQSLRASSQRTGSQAGSARASTTLRGGQTLPAVRPAAQRRPPAEDRRSSARSSAPVTPRKPPTEVRSATVPTRRAKNLQQPATAKPQELYHQQQHAQQQLYQQHVEQAQFRSREDEKRPQPVGRDSSPEKEKKSMVSSWFGRSAPPQPRRRVTYGKSVEELAVQRRSMVSIPQPWMERMVTLCKDKDGRVGLRCQSINKGVFIVLVQKNSPAAMSGLRFGDQILQINDESVAGYSMDKVHDIFRKARSDAIRVAVRDRPFERTVTMHKDSAGTVGFQYRDGKIMTLVKDSSAARNGLLIEHHLLEINGQNVVGLKDKETKAIIDECGSVVTVTVMPSFIFEHMMKKVHTSIIEKLMDHSIPDF